MKCQIHLYKVYFKSSKSKSSTINYTGVNQNLFSLDQLLLQGQVGQSQMSQEIHHLQISLTLKPL